MPLEAWRHGAPATVTAEQRVVHGPWVVRGSQCPARRIGDAGRYTLFDAGGRQIEFDNFYLSAETHAEAFERAGFREFRWIDVSLHPSQAGKSFWDDFMADPPIVAFAAER